MKRALLITVGHNASAIFTDGETVIGYEQERLDQIKSSSQFPTDAINEIIKNVGISQIAGCHVYISHWFDGIDKNQIVEKDYGYKIDKKMINTLEKMGCLIYSHSRDFTHHDAHAWSSYAFFRQHLTQEHISIARNSEVFFIVADGFGNRQETLSIYKTYLKDISEGQKNLQLVRRVYGYSTSLGLMYQYATSFTGMKENQDEYKYLGYESHIDKYFNHEQIEQLQRYITNYTTNVFKHNLDTCAKDDCSCHEYYIDIEQLSFTKHEWHETFRNVLNLVGVTDNKSFQARVAIAFLIQGIIEGAMGTLITEFKMDNVVCSGGIFYNVKLNNSILNKIGGLFSVVPVCGDQGAAIGYYEKYEGNFPFNHLYWGKRSLYGIEKQYTLGGEIKVFDGLPEEAANFIVEQVAQNKLVNVVYGAMEFGPRALLHTTSLFLPTKENTEKNNYINHRNEVMPMAPVMTEDNLPYFFDEKQFSRVVGSDRYMIVTYDYKIDYMPEYAGVMHKYPLQDKYSGRPQVLKKGEYMYNILKRIEGVTGRKCCVNTSYNAHGRPIVFNTSSIVQNYEFQINNQQGIKPLLVIIK